MDMWIKLLNVYLKVKYIIKLKIESEDFLKNLENLFKIK